MLRTHMTLSLCRKVTLPLVVAALTHAGAAAEPDLRYDVQAREQQIDRLGTLSLEATLTNRGAESVKVYWGDYAHTDMYRFEVYDPDGRRVPCTNLELRPSGLPVAAHQRYFRTIAPGQSVKYDMVLGTIGANTQRVSFARPGLYTIETSLNVTTDHLIDELAAVPRPAGAWTGKLVGPPIAVTVTEQLAATAKSFSGDVCIAGKVVAPSGKPLPNATVRLGMRMPGGGGSIDGWYEIIGPQVSTDDKGEFELPGVSATAASFSLQVAHPGYPIRLVRIVNDGRDRHREEIKLTEPTRLRGQVLSEAGLALHGIRVSGADGAATYTDEQGGFLIPAAPLLDDYRVTLYFPGYQMTDSKVTRQQATDGSWSITLPRESKREIQGVAVFPDGRPLANAKLEFQFLPSQRGELAADAARGDRTKTDAQGRFKVSLPTSDAYDVEVMAEDTSVESHLPHDSWVSRLLAVTPSMEDCVFEFDNRRTLKQRVVVPHPLPEQLQIEVMVYHEGPTTYRRVPLRKFELGPQGGVVELKGISASRYRIETMIHDTAWNWGHVVEVAETDEPTLVTTTVPEIKFGKLSGQVRFAPGAPEASLQGLRISYGSNFAGGSVLTDAQGHFAADVPAGLLLVNSRVEPWKGQAKVTVRPGEVGEVTLALSHRDQVTGVVSGQALFVDGKPIAGAMLNNMPWGTLPPGAGEGRYETRLPVGKSPLQVYLGYSPVWMAATGRADEISTRPGMGPAVRDESVTVIVDVKPGAQQQDLRLAPGKRTLTSRVRGRTPAFGMTTLVVDGLAPPSTSGVYRRVDSGLPIWGGGEQPPPDAEGYYEHVLQWRGVPEGERSFLFTYTNSGAMLWSKLSENAGEAPSFDLDESRVGQFEVSLKDEQGEPIRDTAVWLTVAGLPEVQWKWAQLDPTLRQLSEQPTQVRLDKGTKVLPDGTCRMAACSPGDYLLRVTRGYEGDAYQRDDWGKPLAVSLPAGKLVRLRGVWSKGEVTWAAPEVAELPSSHSHRQP
ncbi:MAG: carboxypeptidase regulatory-like domain-containing protein [Planctomycetales bacterium]|nr:carboxypeptidase regulatory-like domain-containing protein [Planctomycetales bacterium]